MKVSDGYPSSPALGVFATGKDGGPLPARKSVETRTTRRVRKEWKRLGPCPVLPNDVPIWSLGTPLVEVA